MRWRQPQQIQLAERPLPYSPRDTVIGVEQHLAQHGLTILDLVCPAHGPDQQPQEIWDPASHALWFFHSHPGEPRFAGEVGHFHTFLGAAGMPRGANPLVLPEMAMASRDAVEAPGPVTHLSQRSRGHFGHIIGISVDAEARPIGLFTTNRWVTGEIWYRAADMIRLLDHFHLEPPEPGAAHAVPGSTPISLWLMGVMALLRPSITQLLGQRDEAVMDWRRRRSRQSHVFDDRRLEMPSLAEIDFAAILQGG